MFQLGKHCFDRPIMLAPMEEVTDISYRVICRELGADVVFTEFINSDGLVREKSKSKRSGHSKMKFLAVERPLAIQIYGNDINNMVRSAVIAEKEEPDFIDINAGCWVKKVSSRGAGAGLLKDPAFMQKMIAEVIRAVDLPVTVKTRIGWDDETINIVEVAQRLEEVGVQGLTIHCRTRSQGHTGEPRWEWIDRVKEKVSIPVILNGGIMNVEDAMKAFKTTECDGIMVARGAIGAPWVFREIKNQLQEGQFDPITLEERAHICLRHLRAFIELKQAESVGIRAFRKFYGGYLKGLPEIARLRKELMELLHYDEVEEKILKFVEKSSQDSYCPSFKV